MTARLQVAGWTVLALAGILSLYCVAHVALLPVEDLVTYVADDTFYYLVLARNLAGSGHLTFDGINSASGVHPAWLAITALLSTGFEGAALVRAAIAAAFLCHVGASIAIVMLVRRAGRADLAPWAGALWLANPISLSLVVEAMEAPLFVMVLGFACLLMLRLLRSPAPSGRLLVMTSAMLGLLCTARTDGALAAGFGVLAVGLTSLRHGSGIPAAVRTMAALAVGPALAVGGFLLYLKLETGHFTQSSAELKMFWGSSATSGDKLAFLYHVFGRLTFGAVANAFFGVPTRLSAVAAIIVLPAVAIAAARRWMRGDAAAGLSTWLLMTAVAASAIYALVLYEYRAWYLGLPVFAMFAALLLASAPRVPLRAFAAVTAIMMALMAREDLRLAHAGAGRYPYARAIYESVAVFDRLVPHGDVIASFDAGVRGFFAAHRVINLDGLVNDATRPYWKAGRLDAYIAAERIRFIADEKGNFDVARQFTALPELDAIACVPVRAPGFRDRCLWRVRE